MWAISLLTIVLLFPLLSAAPLDIAGDVKDDTDGMHSHDENVTRGGKLFGHNRFDMGDINVPGSVAGDDVSIGHKVDIDVQGHAHDHHHHEAESVIECKEGLREMFKSIDSNKDGLMDAMELLRVCHRNNIQITKPLALRILTLPEKTVRFNMAKFCELLKDFPSTNSADSIYFLLKLFDKDSCSGTESDWDCCSSTFPCKEKEGDCDTDDDCVGSLVCGKDNCRSFNPLAYHLADCCIQPGTSVDGGLSAWSSWSDCIGFCGETKTRTRACSSTAGDKLCTGATTETVGCDLPYCEGAASPGRQVCYGNGMFRDPVDCAAYYVCNGEVTTKHQCPPKTSFDPAGHCDWTKNVNCTYPDYHITPDKPKGIPSLSDVQAMEEKLTSEDEFMKMVKHSIRTLDSSLVYKIAPGVSENPENVKRVEAILKESDFEYLFPQRDSLYTYHNFLQAIGKFPAICDTYKERDSDLICKKTLATMFAHFTQETGGHNRHDPDVEEWRQGLVWLREMGCNEESAGCGYNGECVPGWISKAWPCGTNPDGTWKKYFGRGAKQLSYNFNYGLFSDAIYGKVSTLLDEPSLVADTWLSFASAMWFYVYPQPPKPSMLFVIDGTWQPNEEDTKNGLEAGLGATIAIINGGIECPGRLDKVEMPQALNRINYYKKFSEYFKVDIEGEQLSCAHMTADPFKPKGSGSLPIYWDQANEKYQCKLVSWQTAYTALKKGDYVRCVQDYFDVFLTNP